MRIQNNITAMNTHRMYTINNDNVAKSAEKLSSGYRINRAGDAAAGLAISEKMRAQIRGLNMATKNSQDAISLVQTAEGALQETHSMLQRMNELAVQAATGTNEGFDRTQAAKEFEQLKREINDVAEQTNFNNMKILDGSLSYSGYVRSAQTAGVNATVETTSNVVDSAFMTEAVNASGYTSGQIAQAGVVAGTGTVATGTPGLAATLDKNTNYQLQLQIGNDTYNFQLSGKDAILTDDATGTVGGAFNGATATVKVGGKDVTITLDNGTDKALKANTEVDLNWADVKLNLVSWKPNDRDNTTTTQIALDTTAGKVQNGVAKADKTAVNHPTQTVTIDQSKLNDGDSITIGDKTYVFYAGEEMRDANGDIKKTAAGSNTLYGDNQTQYVGKDADGNAVESSKKTDSASMVNIVYNSKDVNSAAKLLHAAIGATAGANNTAPSATGIDAAAGSLGITSTQAGNTVKITATIAPGTQAAVATANNAVETNYKNSVKAAEAANKAIAVSVNSAGTKDGMKTTVEFDVAKMKDGDKFTISAGSTKIEVSFNGESRKKFMEKVQKAVDTAGATGYAEVKGNALIVTDKKVDTQLEWNEELNEKTNALRVQVGANENEQLALSIDSMNTKGLGLDDAHLTVVGQSTDENIDSAGAAITAVKAAINKVSDQRATLGAMQNRLDHKIANLKVTSENLSAAESRIRDVDMAQEMTNFTKNNILSQAATAMLAQANALPQNVLSLLG